MIKILVDEDMPRPTADLLRSLDIDAFDVREIGLRGATDQEIFKYAQKKEMIIISRDKGLSSTVKYPLGTHCGIIVARLPYTFVRSQILSIIEKFFIDVENGRLPNKLTILEVGKYRVKTVTPVLQ